MLSHIRENLMYYSTKEAIYYLGEVDELEGVIASNDNISQSVSISDAFSIMDNELHSKRNNFDEDSIRMFELFYFYQMPIDEIAKLFNKKSPTIRRRINVIRSKLTNILFNSKE